MQARLLLGAVAAAYGTNYACVKMLDEWVQDRTKCIEDIREATMEVHEYEPTEQEVKDIVLAAINGASVGKWVREKWRIRGTPHPLAVFERDMRTVRANAQFWFPEPWKHAEGAGSDWKRRARTVYFAMTSLEDEVLEVMRQTLPRYGARCDALTGDGLLARPAEVSARPLGDVLRALEVEVLSITGVTVLLSGKTLDGNAAKQWSSTSAPSPDSGHSRKSDKVKP